jgi:Caspase domain
MANYWVLSVGINQYRFLPPLSYAQRDAELLHETLLQAGISPRHSRLLNDQITVTSADPRFPTAENLQTQLAFYRQSLKPGDVLLCFFSGYGLSVQDKDYLLPIEADPRQVATTGIAVESLMQMLKAFPTQNIVLLLDVNRSQLGVERGGFGAHTAQLAQTHSIATLLSCQPDQFSHEPLTLRQGIFTTALVSALREGCITLEQLVATLSQRMPQLSEELWRPRQDLLAVVPPHLRYQILLPEQTLGRRLTAPSPEGPESKPLAGEAYPLIERAKRELVKPAAFLSLLSQVGSDFKQTVAGWFQPSPTVPPVMVTGAGSIAAIAEESAGPEAEPPLLTDEFFWRRLLVQGGLIAGILLFGVILRNSSALINASDRAIPTADPVPQTPVSSAAPEATPVPAGEPVMAVDPILLMQSAQAAFEAQQYDDANRQLAQIPAAQRTPEQNQLLEQINRELLNRAKTMLIRTREPRAENQVSDLVEAIKVARVIRLDQPLYQEAQQNMDRWSRVIMDMAQGRAERSNDASVMDAANNYSMAISAARLVPTDQKVHEQAMQAIGLWSQKILDLAAARATNGELDLAIQIGELVPPNTAVYASAQEAIASWRNQPAPPLAEELVTEGTVEEPAAIEPEVIEPAAIEPEAIEPEIIEPESIEPEAEY